MWLKSIAMEQRKWFFLRAIIRTIHDVYVCMSVDIGKICLFHCSFDSPLCTELHKIALKSTSFTWNFVLEIRIR